MGAGDEHCRQSAELAVEGKCSASICCATTTAAAAAARVGRRGQNDAGGNILPLARRRERPPERPAARFLGCAARARRSTVI